MNLPCKRVQKCPGYCLSVFRGSQKQSTEFPRLLWSIAFLFPRPFSQGSFCNRFRSLIYRLPRPPPNRRKPHFFGWHCLPNWLVYFGARYPLCAFSTTGTGYDTVNIYALPKAFFLFLCFCQRTVYTV